MHSHCAVQTAAKQRMTQPVHPSGSALFRHSFRNAPPSRLHLDTHCIPSATCNYTLLHRQGSCWTGDGYTLLYTFMYLLIYCNWYKITNFHFLWFLGSPKRMKLHFYSSVIKIWGAVNDNNQIYGFCWFEVF